MQADIDVSSFDPITITFIEELGKKMNGNGARSILALNRWSQETITPEMHTTIMNDILNKRNDIVIGHLEKALKHYDMIVVPWGALHMAAIEESLLDDGFKLQKQKERVSLNFWKALFKRERKG
jgi:hypothetical protein